MITHFAELQLPTVSIRGVKQVYGERLGWPVAAESDDRIVFRLTQHTKIVFVETYAPLSPVHFALQVPFTKFHQAADWVRQSGLPVAKWEDGHEIDEENGRLNLYFRDCDGNLLEIIAHDYVAEDVLPAEGHLHALYLREVLLGKSLGTLPIVNSFSHNERFTGSLLIVLTPLLHMEPVYRNLLNVQQRTLCVIGDQDPVFDPEKINGLRANSRLELAVIENANHALEVEHDVAQSILALEKVVHRIHAFVQA